MFGILEGFAIVDCLTIAKWYNGEVGVLVSLRGPVRRLLHVGRRFFVGIERRNFS